MRWIIVIVLLLVNWLCYGQKDKLLVAAASSLTGVLEELKEELETELGLEINYIYGSSGKLANQLYNGAPYDVLISANFKFTQFLSENAVIKNPRPLAQGKLVLWSKNKLTTDIYVAATDPFCEKVAIANPELAPYGKLAKDFLSEELLLGKIENKLVIGSSVGQVNQYVKTESVCMALTSASTMAQLSNGYWKELSKYIVLNTISVSEYSENPIKANEFVRLVKSESKAGTFKKHRLTPVNSF